MNTLFGPGERPRLGVVTVLGVVLVQARARRSFGPPGRPRASAIAGLAALLALLGHLVGGGTLPTSCGLVLAALLAATTTTWLAVGAATRLQSPWSAFAILGVGQLGIEALLSAPTEHLPTAPFAATAVHSIATLALGTVVLGVDRVVDDLLDVLDRALPRWWRMGSDVETTGQRFPVHFRVFVPRQRFDGAPSFRRGPPALTRPSPRRPALPSF